MMHATRPTQQTLSETSTAQSKHKRRIIQSEMAGKRHLQENVNFSPQFTRHNNMELHILCIRHVNYIQFQLTALVTNKYSHTVLFYTGESLARGPKLLSITGKREFFPAFH